MSERIIVNSLGALFDREQPPAAGQSRQDYMLHMFTRVTERSVGLALESGMTAVNVTVGYVDGQVDSFEHTLRDLGRWNRIFERFGAQLAPVRNAGDIEHAGRAGKLGVIFGSQNSVILGDDASRVELFGDLGLRVFQLTYNKQTPLGDGCLVPEDRGLTPFGREVVAQLNRQHMIVDLSHSGRRTCLDTVAASQRPVTISHTGCRALSDVPRNKSDAELRQVAEHGGYVGIYFSPFLREQGPARAVDAVAHIEHALGVCGEDHVGIGTDGLVAPVVETEEYRQRKREYLARRREAGLAAPGESEDRPYYVVDLTGPEQFNRLANLLEQRGHSQRRIDKILGLNFVRVARDVWGA